MKYNIIKKLAHSSFLKQSSSELIYFNLPTFKIFIYNNLIR